MSDGMQVVGLFDDPDIAHLARLQLEFQGIESQVLDQHIVATNPLYAPAVGGIRLVVKPEDFEAATAALAEAPVDNPDPRHCHHCGATGILEQDAGRRSAFLTILLLGFPIGRSRPKLICERCGRSWRE